MVGRFIGGAQQRSNTSLCKLFLTIGIVVNIGMLFSFKYANFFVDNINVVLEALNISLINMGKIHLPLGISFFTFQAVSYIIDVYRKETEPQKNLINLALYISLFPQLIAGPIVRYHDVAKQIVKRRCSTELFTSGVQKFIFGLSKKMLLANPLGEVADITFQSTVADLTLPVAWIGILAYTFQIYFDFSGYSDMAIGLGRMFGFHFIENFNYPYISKSLREFWKRWHISLSTWFKDYVYIPLGGSRCSTFRVYLNLLIVFVLTGFWHGASWNFLFWGLWHGLFLAFEHAGFLNFLDRLWNPIRRLYVLFFVVIGWVFFRAETLSYAFKYLHRMFDFSNLGLNNDVFNSFFSCEGSYVFVLSIIFSTPIYLLCRDKMKKLSSRNVSSLIVFRTVPRVIILMSLFVLCMLKISSSTYNPFIYFRF